MTGRSTNAARAMPLEWDNCCEKKGFCPIDDDMPHEIYPLIRKADVIVVATPIFFYNTTAQMKALIDRVDSHKSLRLKKLGTFHAAVLKKVIKKVLSCKGKG